MTDKRTLKAIALAPTIFAVAMLSGCFEDDKDADQDVVVVAPTPTPTMTPAPTTADFDVTPCLEQDIPGTGFTVAQAVVPDTLTLNLAGAAGFPNGRLPADPVIDVTLGVIFLDLGTHSPATLAGLPLNPPRNDVAFPSGFPFIAAPQGSPPVAAPGGAAFTFRTDNPSTYVRVDRMGMPAVSTALIGSDRKVAYNDASPADDAAGTFVPDLAAQLTGLTNALADDLTGAGLTPCAVPA